jgi:hypothetical protein
MSFQTALWMLYNGELSTIQYHTKLLISYSFFHEHYWPVVYRERDVGFLLDRGVSHLVLLQYAHKPGEFTKTGQLLWYSYYFRYIR